LLAMYWMVSGLEAPGSRTCIFVLVVSLTTWTPSLVFLIAGSPFRPPASPVLTGGTFAAVAAATVLAVGVTFTGAL